jgi:hypothetical protein
MSDVVSEGQASGGVLYAGRWNERLRKPIKGHDWLSAEEAAQRYAARAEFVAVDATRGPDGELRPRWVLGFGARGVRARFFTPGGGSIEQTTDYDDRDGRLWRWITRRYLYPDDARFYGQSESVAMYTAEFDPDGTGYIDFTEKGKPAVDRARMTDAPVSDFWLEWPEFGRWDDLADRDYGVPPEQRESADARSM